MAKSKTDELVRQCVRAVCGRECSEGHLRYSPLLMLDISMDALAETLDVDGYDQATIVKAVAASLRRIDAAATT